MVEAILQVSILVCRALSWFCVTIGVPCRSCEDRFMCRVDGFSGQGEKKESIAKFEQVLGGYYARNAISIYNDVSGDRYEYR